jgi:hypothetical protein
MADPEHLISAHPPDETILQRFAHRCEMRPYLLWDCSLLLEAHAPCSTTASHSSTRPRASHGVYRKPVLPTHLI